MGRGMKSQQLTDKQIDEKMFGGWIDAAQKHASEQKDQAQGGSTTEQQQK
jgi:hypothetical protein